MPAGEARRIHAITVGHSTAVQIPDKHKKRGARERTPRLLWGVLGLESESQTELQLTHAVRCIRRSIGLDIGDLTGVASAVYAEVTLRGAEAEHRMVEHVVGVETELRFDLLGEIEALRQRQVGEEGVRTAERVATDVADLAATGQGKWSRCRTSQ